MSEQERKLVPYDPKPVAIGSVKGLKVTLDNGTSVNIGVYTGHPEGSAIYHEYQRDLPDGTRSQLRFAISLEAVLTTARLYTELGLLDEFLDSGKGE